jgi:colanic acid biosynthesis glycosyl transferase WcaI
LIERGVDGKKIDVVLNGVDLSKYEPALNKDRVFAEQYDLADKFVVGYVGTHGLAHSLDKIVEAAELLTDLKDVRVLFAGGGAAKADVEKLVNDKQLLNVVLIPRQQKELMPQLWSLCDISLISLKDTDLFKTVIPSKIFESMGMGLPMVMTSPIGEATNILEASDSGVIVNPESPQEVAQVIRDLFNDPSRLEKIALNSCTAAKSYDRKKLAELMISKLKELV